MRMDKYLWAIRLFKTRSMATKACNAGHVRVEGSEVKPARDARIGEIIEVKKLPIWRSYKVLDLPKSRVGAKLVPDYMVETTTEEELEQYEIWKLAQKDNRPRGVGRPTKRERRTIDKFKNL